MTNDAESHDLIIFAGDLNANGQKENKKAQSFREQVLHREGFDEVLSMLEDEYKAMYDIVSGVGKDDVIDCARMANGGESPVTYADIDQDF